MPAIATVIGASTRTRRRGRGDEQLERPVPALLLDRPAGADEVVDQIPITAAPSAA